ncbi:hypothetical protein KC19_3G182900 [Ceratodon purpureus]|uniref:Uncharacterized protein n=1 Tax=Ceratodon purpureus TaxID=3225 RepID=A0A8T0INP6_CERPU|nr:hypothetical protein KC19_3G182900 [Ceratodon purpureus]
MIPLLVNPVSHVPLFLCSCILPYPLKWAVDIILGDLLLHLAMLWCVVIIFLSACLQGLFLDNVFLFMHLAATFGHHDLFTTGKTLAAG